MCQEGADHGSEHLLQTLIRHKSNLSARDADGNTVLHLVAGSGLNAAQETILSRDDRLARKSNHAGQTAAQVPGQSARPIHLAVARRELSWLKLLLDQVSTYVIHL
jgi:ankyrin repeat protein